VPAWRPASEASLDFHLYDRQVTIERHGSEFFQIFFSGMLSR